MIEDQDFPYVSIFALCEQVVENQDETCSLINVGHRIVLPKAVIDAGPPYKLLVRGTIAIVLSSDGPPVQGKFSLTIDAAQHPRAELMQDTVMVPGVVGPLRLFIDFEFLAVHFGRH